MINLASMIGAIRSRGASAGGGAMPPGGGEPPGPPDNVIHHWFGQPERPATGPMSAPRPDNVTSLPEPQKYNWDNIPDQLIPGWNTRVDPRTGAPIAANEPTGPDAQIMHSSPAEIGEGPVEPLGGTSRNIAPPGPEEAMLPRGSVVPGNQPIDWDTPPMQPNQIGGPPGLMLPWVQNIGGGQPSPMEGIGQPPMDQGGGLRGAEIPSTSDGTAGAETDSGMFGQPSPQAQPFTDFGGMGLPGPAPTDFGGQSPFAPMDFGGQMPQPQMSDPFAGNFASPMQPAPMSWMDFFGGGLGGGGGSPFGAPGLVPLRID